MSAPGTEVLPDGFSTIVTLDEGEVRLKLKSINPFGLVGGGAVPQSTMENIRYRTQLPKQLADVSDLTGKYAYASDSLDDVISQLQVNQEIHVTHGDGETWAFFGWLEEFQPGESKEGEQPEATCKFLASNIDPADGAEVGPWLLSPP